MQLDHRIQFSTYFCPLWLAISIPTRHIKMKHELMTRTSANWAVHTTQPVRLRHILLLSILALVWLWICKPSYLETNNCLDAVPPVLSFEDTKELDYFEVSPTSYLATSSKHYKDGFHSLLWRWQPGDRLTLPLGRRVTGNNSGIKIWIYRNDSSNANVTISLVDSTLLSNQPSIVIRFNFSLNFKGWRPAWVGLREAKSLPKNPGYDGVVIDAPTADLPTKVIFVDLLCLSTSVAKQSRDKIVPPIDHNLYTITSLWQQVYKWSPCDPSTCRRYDTANGTRRATVEELNSNRETPDKLVR